MYAKRRSGHKVSL